MSVTFWATQPTTPTPLLQPVPGATPQPVFGWEPDASTGKRRPSDTQERTAEGLPIWEIAAFATLDLWGREDPQVVKIRWAGEKIPPLALTAAGLPPVKGAN